VRSAFWHGLVVWGVSVTAMTVLSTLGIRRGCWAFGLDSSAAGKAVVGATGTAA